MRALPVNPTPLRWPRRVLLALLALAAALAIGWRLPRVRHELCFELSKRERALDASPRTPEPGPASAVAATPHLLHAGKPGPGFLANTERSLRGAAAMARAIEIDVTLTRDLIPYVSHDDDLGLQLGTGRDRVSRHTAAEIDAMTLTDGSRLIRLERFAAELLPRFERVAVDLKTSQDDAERKAARILAALGDTPPGLVQIIGRPGPVLTWMKRLRPALPVGCESYGPIANRAAGFDLFSARASEVTRGADRRARERGLYRLYWTASTADELARIQAWRPDGIIVDLADAGAEALPAEWRRGTGP